MKTPKVAATKLNARWLRIILLVGLVLLLIGSGAGFYFGQKMLRDFAVETSKLNSQAAQTDQNLATLKKIRQYLAEHQTEEQKAVKVVAESKQYSYQDEIIRDISMFASQSGVAIKNFTFNASSGTTGTSTTAPAASSTTSGTTPTSSIAGLKSTTVTFTIDESVRYSSLLNFIHRIEQNLTKMQIASISLSKSQDKTKSPDLVTTEGFTIEVYIK